MNDTQTLLSNALRLQQSRRIQEALDLYNRVLPRQQNNAELLYLIGSANLQMGRTALGIEQLQLSLALSPKNSSAYANIGVAHRNLKRLDEALASYDQALAIDPGYVEAYNGRSIVLQDLRRLDEALASCDRALAIKPDYPDARINRGNILRELGRLDEALDSFDKALAIDPGNPDTHNNRGVVLQELKRWDDALASYNKAFGIKPDYAAAYYNRGNVLQELGRGDDALASFDKAIAINPNHANAYNNRGNVLRSLKRWTEALTSYDKALAINPSFAEAYKNRGVILHDLKRLNKAVASYDKALAINPNSADAYNCRGVALQGLKRPDEALVSYDKALAINPDFADAHNNRGNALGELQRPDKALVSYEKALAINPNFADAYNNRGVTLQSLKRLDEALASYDRALAIKPDYATAYHNKSFLLILTGKYLEGWTLYEWRLRADDAEGRYDIFPQLAWRGVQDIRGKKLLLQAEQGLGDVIQFCRYLPWVCTLGAELIVEVPRSLLALASTLDCPMSLVEKGTRLPEFDAYCPIASLPYVFRTTIETIPAKIPYLFADATKVQRWRQKLGSKERFRVGLAWSGAEKHKNDKNRSIRLEEFLALTNVPSVDWHSLQKEYRQPDFELLKRHPEIRQHQGGLHDFSDTAALAECMDLIISVDTGVAHLAGAIGKPVWILLPFSPDYRWMLDREDTAWYPTAKLYRQAKLNDWQNAIARVRQDLVIFAENSTGS